MRHKTKYLSFIGLVPFLPVVAMATNITLTPCDTLTSKIKATKKSASPDDVGNPFYCMSIGGGAFSKPSVARFDSAASTLTMPDGCLKNGSYTVVQTGVTDPFGRPAEIVQGEVSIMNGSTPAETVENYQFYADTNMPCGSAGQGGNFGGALGVRTNITGNVASKKKSLKDFDNCLAPFLLVGAQNNKQPSKYGYSVVPVSGGGLTMNVGTGFTTQGVPYSQTSQGNVACGGLTSLPSYQSSFDATWPGLTVGGFDVVIGNTQIPVTKSPSGSTSGDSKHKVAMYDSGGGMMIISDDSNQTIVKALQSGGITLDSTCGNISWLKGCSCVKNNPPVSVFSASAKVYYKYNASDVLTNQQDAVAICPLWTPTGPYKDNPYVSPNGFNPGYEFFRNISSSIDYKSGALFLQSNSSSSNIKESISKQKEQWLKSSKASS